MMNRKTGPRLTERAAYLIKPEWGQQLYNERREREREKLLSALREAASERTQMSATGYGAHGANTTKNSLVGWLYAGGSAEDDIDLQGSKLRKRARDLYAGGGLGRGAPATLVTNVVGWAVTPKPQIDGEVLGMSDEACAEWERNALREFTLWAKSPMCDAARQQNFWSLQELAFRSHLMSGDVFVLFGMKENRRMPYQTVIRLIESDRICTPDSDGESEARTTDSGGRIVDGVEIDKEGATVRYHIANRHPLMEEAMEALTWTTIDAYGKDTGYPNILHLMTFERPEQRRGIPFVSAMIEQIKQLDRYIDSELAANIVSSMLTAFLESDRDDGKLGLEDAISEEEKVTDDDLKLELAPGAIYNLPPGKKVKEVNPLRSNSAFEGFVTKLETLIGASVEIPQEVLMKRYNSNYTAARGALLDFWRIVRRYRARFNDAFNQPIYEQWLSEAVALGRIEAPGFFEDAAIREAWCGCKWMGASQGHVNPVQEANAAKTRIALNISTEEQEAAEYNGNDWNAVVRQRKKELTAFDDIQSRPSPVSAITGAKPPALATPDDFSNRSG